MRRGNLVRYVLLGTGLVACPCHLPLTLPLLAGILGGSMGVFLTRNFGLVFVLSGVYFLGAFAIGLHKLGPEKKK